MMRNNLSKKISFNFATKTPGNNVKCNSLVNNEIERT